MICIDSSAGIERIENSFDKNDVTTTVDEAHYLLSVRIEQLIVSDVPESRILDLWRNTCCSIGWTDGSSHKAPSSITIWIFRDFVCSNSRQSCSFDIHLIGIFLKSVIGLGDPCTVESVCLDNICTGPKVLLVDFGYKFLSSNVQEIIVILHLFWTFEEFFDVATIVLLLQLVDLDLSAHASVEDDNALLKDLVEVRPQLVNVEVVSFDRLWFRIHVQVF